MSLLGRNMWIHSLILVIFLTLLSDFVYGDRNLHHHRRQNVTISQAIGANSTNSSTTPELTKAESLLAELSRQQGEYNTWRTQNPKVNKYHSSHSAEAKAYRKQGRDTEPLAPILNDTIRAAAKLVSEHDAAAQARNGSLNRKYQEPEFVKPIERETSPPVGKRDSTFWWAANAATKKNGLAPMGGDSSWLVYRDVTNPMFAGGAKGDGKTDDTAAINAAIAFGGNCGGSTGTTTKCLSSSVKGTFIYFPAGTYLISTPIQAYYYSQLVGDALFPPTIKTSAKFIGLGAIETDVYIPEASGDEWYIEQSNFYRQVRNLHIDIMDTTTAAVAGLHWQVAQATSLTNVRVYAPTKAGTTAMGMYTENGSGGFMSDCYFFGGQYGILGGNQQYTVRNFEISSQTTAGIVLNWDWGWTWSQLRITNTPIGIKLLDSLNPKAQPAGSIYLLDSSFVNVVVAIYANSLPATVLGSSIITLDNIGVTNVGELIGFVNGNALNIAPQNVKFLIVGNVKDGGTGFGMYNANLNDPDPSMLDTSLPGFARPLYYSKSRPQYEGITTDAVVNVKDHGVKGDGKTDDTAAIQAVLNTATVNNLIYFPAGSYIITKTLTVNPGSRITGQVWSQLVASGSYFANLLSPQVMVKVGSKGDVGTMEISDMLFTSKGALPGLVLMEWNIAADEQGSAGLWDSHFRIGGALETDLQLAECPYTIPQIKSGCIAGAMMLHITNHANGYFENMWAWVADHDLDDPKNLQVTVAVARGILIESPGPTWLLGSASEHCVLYQYNFAGSTNTLAGMIQTESPYYQYTAATESPGPFGLSIGGYSNDPIFPDPTCTAGDMLCNFSWAVMIHATSNLSIAGAGLYSWFDNYDQSACVDAQNCQQRLLNNQGANDQLLIWNIVTIGAVEMISDTDTGTIVYAKPNTQANAHPFWSVLGAYADDHDTQASSCADDDTSPACTTIPDCDWSIDFVDLNQVDGLSPAISDVCKPYYILGALGNMLDSTLDSFADADDGYDDLFPDYADFTKSMIPTALQGCMAHASSENSAGGACNKYFSCELSQGGDVTIPKQPCPIPWSQFSYLTEYTMAYTLNDAAGFYGELSKTYGIQQDWVRFTDYAINIPCGPRSGHGPDSVCEPIDIHNLGFPVKTDLVTVTNPKDVFTKSLPGMANLQASILSRRIELFNGAWYGPTEDLVQVISMPVFLMIQAVGDMGTVKSVGKKYRAEKKKQLTLEILSIVFTVVPFLDVFAPEILGLSLTLAAIDVFGNLALSIQSIIDNPITAPMEMLGILTIGGGGKAERDISSLAMTRKGLSPTVVSTVGKSFKSLDDQLQNSLKRHC